MGAVAPPPWTWRIHSSGYLATATLTTARFAGFEPPAVSIVTVSVGRGPLLWRSKAMVLATGLRLGLPSRLARCPSPSGEGECRPYLVEHSAWGSAIPEAWRSGLARESLWKLLRQEQLRPAQYLHQFGEAACRPHPAAECEPALWWSMAMSPPSCSASRSALLRPCSALLRSLPRPMASSTATCSASCLASSHRDRSCLARHP